MKNFIIIILLLTTWRFTHGQNVQIQKPCAAPEASQFDFWIGNWDLTWNDTSHGTNHVLKILDGCSVNENFYSPATNYKGMSWSLYNPLSKIWQQTWMDNLGGYITLKGKYENGEMKLSTEAKKLANGKNAIYRMVFYNIKTDSFDWRWESTTNDGDAWAVNWLIHYKRHG